MAWPASLGLICTLVLLTACTNIEEIEAENRTLRLEITALNGQIATRDVTATASVEATIESRERLAQTPEPIDEKFTVVAKGREIRVVQDTGLEHYYVDYMDAFDFEFSIFESTPIRWEGIESYPEDVECFNQASVGSTPPLACLGIEPSE